MTKPPNLRAWATARKVTGRVVWTVVIWSLFAFFILGPLVTVFTFSLTPSIFEGVRPRTLEWYRQLFSEPNLYNPLLRSFEVAFIVVAVQLVLGTLVAYATVRRRVFGAQFLDAMSNLTIALPSVVVGLALLSFYGPFGPIQALGELMLGHPLAFTWTLWIVVFAHVLETFPYMVRTVGTALHQLPPNLESAARSLGAGHVRVFRTVVLPLLKPSLLSGGVLVFSRSIAEFGATIVVVSAVLRTAPIKIFSEAEAGSLELAAAYSVVLMAVSFAIYLILRRRLLRQGAFGSLA
ncbi:MAG TPA: ABC transporter permease subunit [Candidatus Thermoplasmatota archaeon]|nr:ABC transporter permease subunit [Candidatus Thermoplasmatota archaeon]